MAALFHATLPKNRENRGRNLWKALKIKGKD